jgi:hypothetical protein
MNLKIQWLRYQVKQNQKKYNYNNRKPHPITKFKPYEEWRKKCLERELDNSKWSIYSNLNDFFHTIKLSEIHQIYVEHYASSYTSIRISSNRNGLYIGLSKKDFE